MGNSQVMMERLVWDWKVLGTQYRGIDTVIESQKVIDEARRAQSLPTEKDQKLLKIAQSQLYTDGANYMLLLAREELGNKIWDEQYVNECFKRAQEYAAKGYTIKQTIRRIAKIKATTPYIEKMILN